MSLFVKVLLTALLINYVLIIRFLPTLFMVWLFITIFLLIFVMALLPVILHDFIVFFPNYFIIWLATIF